MFTPNPDIPNVPRPNATDDTRLSFKARPLVLFPVRLETRFFQKPDGNFDLCVRVYPDRVHIDSHEPKLTEDELTWGKNFWTQFSGTEEQRKAAWQQLADRFDPPRAAFVARATKNVTTPIDTKREAWERAPQARALPNQWIVLGYKNGSIVVNAKGKTIEGDLAAGPDPSASAQLDQTGLDTGMKWMVDFATAEKVGMGVRINLKKEIAAAGLDFLIVIGVKDSLEGDKDWTQDLKTLFEAHHYASGLSFIPAGTPSNNTQDGPSGFSSNDPGHETSYDAEFPPPEFKLSPQSNAQKLTESFGLSKFADLFANLPHAAGEDQLDAQHANTALWAATWGYFLVQMLGVGKPNESPLSDADIAWARRHFIDFVRANGPLPALRVGRQPYGVLPVTSLTFWKSPAGRDAEFKPDAKLCDFLLHLRDVWRRSSSNAPRLGRTPDKPNQSGIEIDLPEVLSMDGLSSSYSMRHLMGRQYLEHLWVFLSADFFKDVWNIELPEVPEPQEPPEIEEPPEDLTPAKKAQWRAQQRKAIEAFKREDARTRARIAAQRARLLEQINVKRRAGNAWWETQNKLSAALLDKLKVTWRPRLSKGVFSPPVAPLNGPLVQNGSSSPQQYIESLLKKRDLVKEVWFQGPKFEQPPPHTLLHLLLRHSMLFEYSDVATRLLIKNGVLRADQRREPELVNLQQGQVTQTIWEQMKSPIKVSNILTIPLAKYLIGSTGSGEPDMATDPEAAQLKEFRASLAHLGAKEMSGAKLEQLLSGTLDLCSHRLDAWITSFATKRLFDMRKNDATGVLIGGYGWVMNLNPAPPLTSVATPPGEDGPVFQNSSNPGFIHTPSLAQASTVAVLRSGHLAHAGNQSPNDLLAIDLSSERVRLAMWLLEGVRAGQPLGALLGYRFERRLQEVGKPQFIAPFRELAPLVAKKLEQTNQPVEAIAANNVVDGLALSRRWQKGNSTNPPVWTLDTIPFGQKIGQQKTTFPPFDENNADFRVIRNELTLLDEAVDSLSDALVAESIHQVVRGNHLRAATTVESIAGGETPPPELDVVRTPRSGTALTHRVVTLFSGDPQITDEDSPRAKAEPHLNAWLGRMLSNPAKVRCLVERLDPATLDVVETKDLRLADLRLAPIDYLYAAEGGPGGRQGEIEQRILLTIDGFAPDSLLRVSPKRKSDWAADELSFGQFSELLRATRKLLNGVRALDAHDLVAPDQSAEFEIDVEDLNQRATNAVASLTQFVKGLPQTIDTGTLLRAMRFGVAGVTADREALMNELAQRIDKATATGNALDRLHIVFGKSFLVLPRFKAVNVEELEQSFANSDNLQDGDPAVSNMWLRRMARVRENVGRFKAAIDYAEALKTGEKLKLKIAQLPHDANDRWVALPLQAGHSLPVGKLSVVVQSATSFDVRQSLCGLLIDEWVEVVPGAKETTGIALQYDQPNAAPPQSILIAVPPEPESAWTVWSLQQVLLETLDLARMRAVDLTALDEVGHYLPALYFAYNTAGDAVSTDFTTIK